MTPFHTAVYIEFGLSLNIFASLISTLGSSEAIVNAY